MVSDPIMQFLRPTEVSSVIWALGYHVPQAQICDMEVAELTKRAEPQNSNLSVAVATFTGFH